VALAGFGVDSLVEVASAFLVLLRLRAELRGSPLPSRALEKRAALGIGSLFVLLALGIAAGAVLQLHAGTHPPTTLPGLIIGALSLGAMAWLWRTKAEAGRALDSASVMADATCSRACLQLGAVLAIGSLIFILWPRLWWVDATGALALSLLILKEGVEQLRAALRPGFSGGCGCEH